MDIAEYIHSVKNNLRASHFDEMSPEAMFNIQTKKKFMGVAYGENGTNKHYLSQFSVFYKLNEVDGAYDIRDHVFIVEVNISEDNGGANIYTIIKRDIENVVDCILNDDRSHNQKSFGYILYITQEGTQTMKKAIINGATASHPRYAVLPVLADLTEGGLTYRTEPMGESSMFGRPFITQISERAPNHFSVA